MEKRDKKRLLKSVLSSVLAFSLLLTNFLTAYANTAEDLQIKITPSPNIDVVLTLGNSNFNATNFSSDLKQRLAQRGIDISKVNVESVEATEQNVFYGRFSMNIWWPNNGSDMDSHVEFWSGSTKVSEMYYGNMNVFGCTLDRDDRSGGVGEWSTINFDTIPSNITELRFYVNPYRGDALTNLRLIREINGVSEVVIDWQQYVAYPNKVYFGKLVRNGDAWDFVYNNGTVYPGKQVVIISKKFSEVIRQPSWRENSERFLVNLEDNIVPDFDSPQNSGEILTRLINEEIAYVALGTSKNQAQALNFIARNNGNGTFINNSNYNNAMNQLANYIASKVQSRSGTSSQYVLIGEPVNIEVIPPHLKTNTQTPEYPQGRWRVDHDYTYFENNLGQAANSGQYQKDLQLVFDKPGRYELWFADRHPDPRYIYVHRRPIADFSLNIRQNGSNYTVTVNDRSYDPDYQSHPDRGIAQYEWKWKETSSQNWNNGMIPSTLPQGKDYIIQLRVKDKQGVWSQPKSRYITTSSAVVKPVASFEMPAQATRYQTITVSDTSYDPAGRPITSRQWVVKKNGTQVYSGSSPITNFNSYGEGTYEVILKVQNNAGLWSEEFKRTIVITGDNVKPDAIFDKTRQDWTNQNITVTITFSDDGGSGFNSQRYAVTNSPTFPTSGWSAWDSSTTRTITITNEGRWYIHVEARDNAGNVMQRTMGEYQIDKTPPAAPTLVADKTEPTNKDVIVTINYPADASKKEYKVDNGQWTNYTSPVTMTQNGTVYARAFDQAGNVSAVSSYTVNNIDKVPPTPPTIKQEVDVITLIPGTDDRNGIADTQIRINGGEWISYTAPIQLADGEYFIVAKSIDGVGNEAIATLHTYVYDDTLREAERLTNIAEKFPFPVQSKIDEAKAVVDLLPDVAPEKQGLLDRLKKLQDILDENWIENELDKISRKIDSVNPTPEQLQEWKNKLQEYKNIVNDMFEGEKKQELLDRIDGLLDKIAVLEEFLRVGTPKTVEEIDRLQDLVDTLPDGLLKDRLQKQLDNAKDVISRAVEAVEKAEQTLSKIDYDKAMELVNQVQDENVRQELLDRLDAISEIVHVVGLVEKAEQTKKQNDVNTAREVVNALPDGELKTELTNRLDKIDKDLANAINLVEMAEKTLNPSTVSRAEEAVNKLIDMPKKQELIDRLEAVKDLIASKQAQEQLANAIKAVEKAEQYKREPYISNAFDLVNALPDSDIKTQLLDRLNALLQQIEDERKAQEDAKKEEQLRKLIEEATKKVEQAEKYKRDPYLKNAYDAVNALPDGEAKDALKARLDAIKAELENKEPPKDPDQLELEKKIADATKKVELAEQYKRDPYIKNAEDAVNELPEGAVKDALKARLDALKRALEDEALEKLYQEAERKVGYAEKYKREPYISDAYNVVNALPDGERKDALKTRLDAIRIGNGDEGVQDPDLNEGLDNIQDPVVKMLFLDLIKAVERAEKYFSRANIVYAMELINAIPADVQNDPLYESLFDDLNSRVDALKQTYNAVIANKELEQLIKKAETAVETFERFRSAALKEKAQQAVDAITEPNVKERLQARIDAVEVK